MFTTIRVITACAAATVVVAAGLGAPALAAAQRAPAGPAHIVAGPGGALRPTTRDHAAGRVATPINSSYFAGYQARVPTGSATTSVAAFTVPTVSCTTTDLAITPTAGVSVNSYKTFSVAFVVIGCANGTAFSYPGLVVNGTEHDYPASPVAAGDVIDLTTKVSHFRTRVQVTDMTTGVTEKITAGAGATANAAFTGDDGWDATPGVLEGVPNFGTLTFGNCLLDGKALGGFHPQAYQRVNSSNVVQIATGALSTTGLTFTTQYQNS